MGEKQNVLGWMTSQPRANGPGLEQPALVDTGLGLALDSLQRCLL